MVVLLSAGYIGSVSFLEEVKEVILNLKQTNPKLIYGKEAA
jgi:pyridoxal/pyridoxine/pyridoxamine kinase